ncbi:hypothetical protein BaRGS_00000083 [Batillaria attramentaria]|uniref:Uncharacterized protein n=1 Tax=Batillaria attramentaria TaxID=370345 RepID=A0ABD0M9S5_9CAEN
MVQLSDRERQAWAARNVLLVYRASVLAYEVLRIRASKATWGKPAISLSLHSVAGNRMEKLNGAISRHIEPGRYSVSVGFRVLCVMIVASMSVAFRLIHSRQRCGVRWLRNLS